MLRDRFQRVGEIGLHQPVALRRRSEPSGFSKTFAEDGQRANKRLRRDEGIGEVAVDGEAVARKCDRGRDQLRQRELAGAVFAVRERKPGHRAGHADAEAGGERFLRVGLPMASRKLSRVVAAGAVSR